MIATGFNPVMGVEVSDKATVVQEEPKTQPAPIEVTTDVNMVNASLQKKESLPADLKSARQLAREVAFEQRAHRVP